MIQTLKTPPGLLFASYLYREDLFSEAQLKKLWENQFGSSLFLNPSHNPLFDYYSKEMGTPLARFFAVTQKPYPREALLQTKLLSLEWERSWAEGDKRRVNVDIGFLSAENFILATTKNYSHRVFLGSDIFADLTYQFYQGQFHPFPWTYPDYLDDEKKSFLSKARLELLKSLKV